MKKPLFLLILLVYAIAAKSQNILRGKVTDEQEQPMYGVSIMEKGIMNGVYSDVDGNFSIKYRDQNSVILFSFIGLGSKEVPVGNQKEINVIMLSNNLLSSVEVVGSRRQKRTAVESVVPVDIIEVSQLVNTLGQPDVNQLLQYVAPSFNQTSNRVRTEQIMLIL